MKIINSKGRPQRSGIPIRKLAFRYLPNCIWQTPEEICTVLALLDPDIECSLVRTVMRDMAELGLIDRAMRYTGIGSGRHPYMWHYKAKECFSGERKTGAFPAPRKNSVTEVSAAGHRLP